MATITDTSVDELEKLFDEDDTVHISCCDPTTALCGADLSNHILIPIEEVLKDMICWDCEAIATAAPGPCACRGHR